MLQIITTTPNTLETAKSCLFGLYQGLCIYDPLHPILFFSLGEAVSAFGIIFAVYQLKSPRWDIVLKIRGWIEKNLVWFFGGLGLFFVFLSTVVYLLPFGWLKPPFNFPVLYEILAFISFILAPALFLLLSTRTKGLFNESRAERFYQILHAAIAKSNDQNTEIVVDIISSNLEDICKSLKNIKVRRRQIMRNSGEEEKIEETTPTEEEKCAGQANAVLTVLLGDSKVANYIAVGRLDFLFRFFYFAEKYKISREHTQLGIERIFESLFYNERSYFYSQLDYRGLSLSSNIYEMIFSDPYTLTAFSPFNSAKRWGSARQLSGEYMPVYLKALEFALEGFWKNNCDYSMGMEINRAFLELGEYCQSISIALGNKNTKKGAMESLRKIGFFLGHTYVWNYREMLKKKLISKHEESVKKDNDFDHSVNYGYAKVISDYFEALSNMENEDANSMRLQAITATSETIGLGAGRNSDLAPIGAVIINLLWDKISDDSMSNLEGYFPPVLKVYIALVGFSVGDKSVRNEQRERLIKFLYEKIKPKILSNEKMKDDKTTFEKALLPDQVIFDRADNKFKWKMSPKGFQIM